MRIRVLGATSVEADDGVMDKSAPSGRQARLLFTFLVLERHRAVPRDELADALWSGELPHSWEPALRGVVSKVRSVLAAAGLSASDTLGSAFGCYSLNLPANTIVDIESASSAVEAAEAALRDGQPDRASDYALAAREVFKEPFLAEEEGPWVERVRQEIRARLLRSLELLSTAQALRGQAALAVQAAEECTSLDPLRESAYRCLMAAHAAAGNRGDALRAYERCRRVLAEEMGVQPSAETGDAYVKLLGQEPDVGQSPRGVALFPVPVPEALAPSPLFVGRQRELQILLSAWDAARRSDRQVVVLRGEPGIGKTALAAELAHITGKGSGGTVLYGRCDKELLVPYQPFSEALGRYAAACPVDYLRGQTESEQLVRLIPELAQRMPERTGAPLARHDDDRHRLFASTASFLKNIADAGPIVLVLDDLQWAGTAILLLLRYLVRSLTSAPVLFVLTYRDDEISSNRVAMDAVADLRREVNVHDVPLEGLDEQAVAALLSAIGRGFPDTTWSGLSGFLQRETGGNPFYTVEVARQLVESEAGPRGDSLSGESLLAAIGIPASVAEVIQRRRSRLGNRVGRVLAVASVAGREFDLDVVQGVTGLDDDDLLDAMDQAVEAKLIEEVHDVVGRYRFTEGMARDVIYDELSGVRRARLHARVAETIESLHPEEVPNRLSELSHHMLMAGPLGDRMKGFEFAFRAGQQDLDRFAYERAGVHHRRALSLCSDDHEGDVRRCQVLMALATAERKAGRAVLARSAYLQAATLARDLDDPEALASCALGLAADGEPISAWIADEVRISLLEEALEALGERDGELRVRVLADLAKALYYSEQNQRRDAFARQAIETARLMKNPSALAAALSANRAVLCGPANLEIRLAYGEEMIGLAEQAGDIEMLASARLGRLVDLLESGDRTGADAELDASLSLASRQRQPYFLWRASSWDVVRAMLDGRLDDADVGSRHALTLWQDGAEADALQCFRIQQVMLGLLQNRLDDPDDMRQLAAEYPMIPSYRCLAGMVLAARDLHSAAADVFEEFAADGFVSPPFDAYWLLGMAALAETCVYLRDASRAEVLYELLQPFAERVVVVDAFGGGGGVLGSVEHHLAMLAATFGDWDQAGRRLEAALVAHRRLGARPWEERSRTALAQLRRNGDGSRPASWTSHDMGLLRASR